MKGFGTYLDDSRLCNCDLRITGVYYLDGNNGGAPDAVRLQLEFEDGSIREQVYPLRLLRAKYIEKNNSALIIQNKKQFDAYVMDIVFEAVGNNSSVIEKGLFINKLGMHHGFEGRAFFVIGECIIGDITVPYAVSDAIKRIKPETKPDVNALCQMVEYFQIAPPAYTLAFVFLLTIFLRSTILECGQPLQAVGYIVGAYGRGKTYLAHLLTGWITSIATGKPGLMIEAESSLAGTRDEMTVYRDLPLVSDDACKSESPRIEAKRIEQVATFIRQSANEARIVKKHPNGETVECSCVSGGFITSEITFSNPSDITRCLWIPLIKQANTPSELSTKMVGAAALYCIEWFCNHYADVCNSLENGSKRSRRKMSAKRSENNFRIVDTVYALLERILLESNIAFSTRENLRRQYEIAVQQSMDSLEMALKRANKPPIIKLIKRGLDQNAFDLAQKVEKLHKHEAIIWKEDLCIKKDPLERFVRHQPGYENWKFKQIIDELKMQGLLVIQEEDTYQVRIAKDAPRTYRIRLKG